MLPDPTAVTGSKSHKYVLDQNGDPQYETGTTTTQHSTEQILGIKINIHNHQKQETQGPLNC